jgi:hypothetical protein
MNKFTLLIASLALIASPVSYAQSDNSAAPAPQSSVALKLGVGLDYSRGNYGFADETEVFSRSLNLTSESTHWLLRAVVPYITVKGPASVVNGSGAVFAAPARPTRSSKSGTGDVIGSATFHANPSADQVNIDFTGRVKFGTADEAKGLGTGETDFYAQTDLYRRFGRVTPFTTLGYRFLGDSTLYQLKDGPYAAFGAVFNVTDLTSLGASLDWRSRIVPGGDHAFESTLFIVHNPSNHWNLVGYVLKGYTDASPDVGVGGLVNYRF